MKMGTLTRRRAQELEKKSAIRQVQALESGLVKLREKQLSYVDVFGVVKPYYRYAYQEVTKEIHELKVKIANLKDPEDTES